MKYKIFVLVISIIAIPNAVYADKKQSKLEDQIKFRQSGMMFMRWNMGKIKKQVVKNPEIYNKEDVVTAASAIAAIANSGIDRLYKPETAKGKGWKETRVKPEYFEQPDKVRERYQVFIKEANKLASVTRGGDVAMIKTQFNTLFKSCKSCHKSYRSK